MDAEPLSPEREADWRAYIEAACREVDVVKGGMFDMSLRLFATLDAARSDTGAEERLRAALEVGRLRALLEDLYDRSTPMHSQTCAMQDDEADCICGTAPVLERVSDELRAGRSLSGGSVDEEALHDSASSGTREEGT